MPPRRPKDAQADHRLHALGEQVRRLREEDGRSQEAFAHDCGLHRTYVGAIERGEVNPSVLNIYRLADTLAVSVRDLLLE